MNQVEQAGAWSVIAVCHDQESMERAVRRLHQDGFGMRDLSMIGRDLQISDQPAAPLTTGDYAEAGAEIGAVVGGILGLCLGMAVIVVPGVGPVVAAGSIAAALVGGGEASVAGAAIGGLAGALVGSAQRDHEPDYEAHLKAGEFLVLARGDPSRIEHARSVLGTDEVGQLEV